MMRLHSQRLQNVLVESVRKKREKGGHLVLQGGTDGFQQALCTMYYLVLQGEQMDSTAPCFCSCYCHCVFIVF